MATFIHFPPWPSFLCIYNANAEKYFFYPKIAPRMVILPQLDFRLLVAVEP